MHGKYRKLDIWDRIVGGIIVGVALYMFSLFAQPPLPSNIKIIIAVVGGLIFVILGGNIDKFWEDWSRQ